MMIADSSGAQVKAKLVTFQTISRVYPPNETDEEMRQEGIIFGICLTESGEFFARKLWQMRAVTND